MGVVGRGRHAYVSRGVSSAIQQRVLKGVLPRTGELKAHLGSFPESVGIMRHCTCDS
jgi:hypothetical protein